MKKREKTASDFLIGMGLSSARRAVAGMQRCPALILEARVRKLPAPPPLRLSPQGFDLIAEVKRRSPAAGALAGKALRITEQARSYARGGAAALSVLTEPEAFDGDLSHLQEVAAAVAVPSMRKDFLVSPYQVLEARAAGASGVLLIAAMLNDAQLQDMLRYAHRLGLFALVEIFDAADLAAQRVGHSCCRSGDRRWALPFAARRELPRPAQPQGRLRALCRACAATCRPIFRAWPRAVSSRPARLRGSPDSATALRWSARR